MTEQPMEQRTNPPTRFVRLPEVVFRTGLSRSTIKVRLAEGRFPRPVLLGGRAVGWIEAEVDALVEPFAELAAGSIGLVGDGLDWGSEFTGAAGEVVEAVRDMGSGSSFTGVWRSAQGVADQVSEADILELFRNRPAEVSSRAAADYRQAREAADRQRVLDYAMMDAAASLGSTVESAQDSFDELTANGNLSNTSVSHCVHWLIGLEASDNAPRVAPQSYPHPAIAISVHCDPA